MIAMIAAAPASPSAAAPARGASTLISSSNVIYVNTNVRGRGARVGYGDGNPVASSWVHPRHRPHCHTVYLHALRDLHTFTITARAARVGGGRARLRRMGRWIRPAGCP